MNFSQKIETEHVPCPLCGSTDYKKLSVQKEIFGVVRCRNCCLIYQNPRPIKEALKAIYEGEYYFNAQVGYADYEKTYFRYEHIYQALFRKRLQGIQRFKTTGKILELGSAYGFNLDFFRKQDWEVCGVELSSISVEYARSKLGLEVFQGTLEEANFPANSFDVVLMLDVIEHLADIRSALRELARILKPDGLVVVQVPYELYHWERAAKAILQGKLPSQASPDAIPVHLCFFSPKILKRMLQVNGYRILYRDSGNYGLVRRHISPPSVESNYWLMKTLKKLYFYGGIQDFLNNIAVKIKQGSGIIYYAQPSEILKECVTEEGSRDCHDAKSVLQ